MASPTHYFDVTKHLNNAIEAANEHKTMLTNMARQVELKFQTLADNSNITIEFEKLLSKFAAKIMKSSRSKQIKGVEYAEIFRVIDDSEQIKKIVGSKER